MEDSSRRVLRNTAVQFIGKIITTVISLVVIGLISRELGVNRYGDYGTILTYTQFYAVFTDLGINLYLIKRLSTPGVDEPQEASRALGFRLVLNILILGLAWVISLFMPYSPVVHQGISLGLLAIFAQSLNSLFVSVLQAKLEMVYAVTSEVVGRLVMLGVTLFALRADLGVHGMIAAVAAGGIANLLLTAIFTERFLAVRFAWDPRAWSETMRHSFGITLITILAYLYFKVDSLLLSVLPLPHGAQHDTVMGIYNLAYKVLDILILIPSIFLGNVFPVINSLIALEDGRVREVIQKTFDALSLLAMPLTVAVFLLAPQIISFVGGSGFEAAALPLRILSLALFVYFYSQMFVDNLLALNKQAELIRIYLVATVFNVVANVIFIPMYSYHAAATTTLLTQAIVLVLCYRVSHRSIGFTLSFNLLGKVLLISAALGAELWFLRGLPVVLTALIGAVSYLGVVITTRTLTLAELRGYVSRR